MIQHENKFDSEYCNVKYVEQDNVVLLVWKKFCRFEDYRQPTMFAANLLHKQKGSNFVIDARNGFEDEKADVEWGFSVLLPYMAKSDCKPAVDSRLVYGHYSAFMCNEVDGNRPTRSKVS